MKNARKVVALLLICLMLSSTIAWAADGNSKEDEINSLIQEAIEKANDPNFGKEEFTPVEIVMTEEKYYLMYNSENLLKGNYEDGSVVIGLKKEVTITEGYEELFPELNIVSVSRVGKEMYDAGRILNQIIKITLEEQTHESVVEAIMSIKDNQYVVYAEPDYYLEPASMMGSGVVRTYLPGDVNGDGIISNRDLIPTARIVVGYTAPKAISDRADVNSDGEVNNADVIIVARLVVGLD